MRPVGLYIHIPFCVHKCPYCDFASRAAPPQIAERYCRALHAELSAFGEWCSQAGACVSTIFIGGGTPTLLPLESLTGLLREALALPLVAEEIEVTVEANPGTVSAESLCALRAARANRLSLGVQSLLDAELRTLGRIHTAAQAEAAVEHALAAGFERLSVDLMFGIPGQTTRSFGRTLARVVEWGLRHVSTYCLTFEDGTEMTRRRDGGLLRPPGDSAVIKMISLTDDMLGEAGLRRYEVSNFAAPGHECRHNLTYWRRGEYRGLGASAHSCIGGERFWNSKTVLGYIEGTRLGRFREGGEWLTPEQHRWERVMLALRMVEDGAEVSDLLLEDGTSEAQGESKLRAMVSRGLLEVVEGRARLTPAGLLIADHVALQVLA